MNTVRAASRISLAAMEAPDLLVADVREFFRDLR
jgi:hypothetical protein